MFRAFPDTCVLFKPLQCDTLLSIAEEGVFQPLWSAHVLEELIRNLVRHGVGERSAHYRIGQMNEYFPDAEVTGYEKFIPAMANHPKDRHVLAAASRGHAGVLVTENIKDFPAEIVAAYDIDVSHQDDFLLDQLDLCPDQVRAAVRRQVSRYRRPPRSAEDLLIALGKPGCGCPKFARGFGGYGGEVARGAGL
ncbi:MAG: PIN domain-containing protein [Sciscionella sp.]